MRSDRWAYLPLRRLGAIVGGGTPPSDDENWNGGIPFVTPPDLRPVLGGVVSQTERFLSPVGASSGSSLVPTGSVLLSIRAPIGYVARTDRTVAFNQGCRALVPSDAVLAPYLVYALVAASADLEVLGRGTTFTELSGGQMASFEVPVPPLPKQGAIADFLDRETAQIDTLIARQEQLITTLRERRMAVGEAVLARVVAKGARLQWMMREVDERAGERADTLPLMSVSISWGIRRRDEVTDDLARAENLSRYKVCMPGDIVLNRMRAFQGALGVAEEAGTVSPDYAVMRIADEVEPHWLAAVMKTQTFVGEISRRIKGIGGTEGGSVRTPRINIADLNQIRVATPSLNDQTRAMRQIRAERASIDSLIEKTKRFIELSKERRSALITAAVTGEIDVQGAA